MPVFRAALSPLVACAKIINLLGIYRGEIAANVISLLERTPVVDHDNGVGEIRSLGERGVERLY